MYVGDELAVSPTLPDDFMEDDGEDEIVQINVGRQIVKPIVDDLVKNLDLQELQIIQLKKYVELNMEIVEKESKEQRKESIIEDALSDCIKAAVIFVEAKRGEHKFLKIVWDEKKCINCGFLLASETNFLIPKQMKNSFSFH